MKFQKLIGIDLLILILSLILSQETNQSEPNKQNETKILDSDESNEQEKPQELIPNNSDTDNISISNKNGESYIEVDDDEIQSIEIESIEFEEPLDLSVEEMDMILLCAFISQTALKNNYSQDIRDIAERVGEPNIKKVHDKIGFSFFNVCLINIDNVTVNKYISNLTYHNNFEWEKKFDDYIKLDKDKYQKLSDVKFSIDDQIISKVVKQANEEFEKKKKNKNKNKNKQNNINKKENINNYKSNKNKNVINNSILNEIIFFIGFGIIMIIFFYVIHWCRKKDEKPNNDKDKNIDKKDKKKNKKKKVD